jgi:hypothetical protein
MQRYEKNKNSEEEEEMLKRGKRDLLIRKIIMYV